MRSQPGPAGTGRRMLSAAARPLRAALLCLVGLELTWVLAALVPATHVGDAIASNGFAQLSRPRVDQLANALLSVLSPLSYTLLGLVLVAIALARRRASVALAMATVLLLAPLSAEALKPLLAHPHARVGWSDIGGASWPSGHSTAAMTLALCAVLVSSRRWRPTAAALGSLFAVAVGFSLLILAWHLPSDVFGGYLLAALWVALAVAALRAWEARADAREGRSSEQALRETAAQPRAGAPGPHARELIFPALIVAATVFAALGAVLARAQRAAAFADGHRPVLVAAAGIAALAVVIASSLTVALRR